MSSSTLVIRSGGLAGMLAGLLYFVGYASMAELLLPVMSNLGGHIVLGFAGMATLPTLVAVPAARVVRSTCSRAWRRDAERSSGFSTASSR
jgi:predicted RND superfamily exporter protein